jgi:glycosyltransferase involved in cell wall biosynthesis
MSSPVTICLHIVCKNDAENIISCLRSVHNHITDWVICDIGSTDNTKYLIRDYYQQNPKPGHLIHIAFENWGKTKTQALNLALQYTQSDYLLLLRPNENLQYDSDDSDQQTLQSNHELSNIRDNKITNEIYFEYVGVSMGYTNTGMILCKDLINPRYVGVTHDYFTYDDRVDKPPIICDMAKIRQVSNGFMTSSDKIKLDIKLLHQGLMHEPKNSRYLYYLAKSYLDTKDYYNAIIWFTKRYKNYNKLKDVTGDFWEEAYSSLTYIFQCHNLLNHDYETCSKPLLQAIQINLNRLEAYNHLLDCVYHKGTPYDKLCVYRYIVQYFGTKYRVYDDEHDYMLFVDTVCYDFLFHIRYAYVLIETGHFDDAHDLLDEIIDYLSHNCIYSKDYIDTTLVYLQKEKKRCINKTRDIDKLVMVMVNALNGVKTDELFTYLNTIYPKSKQ